MGRPYVQHQTRSGASTPGRSVIHFASTDLAVGQPRRSRRITFDRTPCSSSGRIPCRRAISHTAEWSKVSCSMRVVLNQGEKGRNVIVFKVVNEKIDFSGSIRFVDGNDAPFKGFKVSVSPEK